LKNINKEGDEKEKEPSKSEQSHHLPTKKWRDCGKMSTYSQLQLLQNLCNIPKNRNNSTHYFNTKKTFKDSNKEIEEDEIDTSISETSIILLLSTNCTTLPEVDSCC